MAFMLKNRSESHGPFDTREELLEFQATLDPEKIFWIDDLSKIKKISKTDQ